jgi:hypothetical protein
VLNGVVVSVVAVTGSVVAVKAVVTKALVLRVRTPAGEGLL